MSRYFKNYEDKYNPFLSSKKPIVVKAKVNIDKSDIRLKVSNIKEIDAIVRKVTRDLSRKYNCIGFSSFNEINLVIVDTKTLSNNNNKIDTQSIVSLFSQEIFIKYNELTRNRDTRFVSVNVFNIFEDRVKSYLYTRQSSGFNDYISLLSSKLFSASQIKNKKREELLDIIEDISPSLKLIKRYIKDGYTVLNGFESEVHNINDLNNLNNSNHLNIDNAKANHFAFNMTSDFVIEEDI